MGGCPREILRYEIYSVDSVPGKYRKYPAISPVIRVILI